MCRQPYNGDIKKLINRESVIKCQQVCIKALLNDKGNIEQIGRNGLFQKEKKSERPEVMWEIGVLGT